MIRPATRAQLRNLACFLAGLCAVHLCLEPCLPWTDLGEVTDKLAFLARHRDDYDAVFVGSSRIYAQIDPARFDARITARTGVPFRSFNFGAPSLFLPESLSVLDRIRTMHSTRLHWVFVELDHPKLRVDEQPGLVRREVYWHLPAQTAVALGEILSNPDLKRRGQLALSAHHLLLCGRRLLHVGAVMDRLSGAWTPPADEPRHPPDAPWPEAGYLPYQGALDGTVESSKNIARDARIFLAQVTALSRSPPPGTSEPPGLRSPEKPRSHAPPRLTWLLRRALTHEARDLRAAGITPVFLVPPVTTPETDFLRWASADDSNLLLAFNDPARYPGLYRLSVRADTMHLNAQGADLFTAALAEAFSPHLPPNHPAVVPPPPPPPLR